MDSLKNIVVGVDFSAGSRAAHAQAVRMAHWNEAALHVVHVIDEDLVSRAGPSESAGGRCEDL
jgi:nucleotide-binding universal stress UspA family protein